MDVPGDLTAFLTLKPRHVNRWAEARDELEEGTLQDNLFLLCKNPEFFFLKISNFYIAGRVKGWKDTSVCCLIWSRWPGSSARGRKPKRWAGRGNHDAPSAEEEEERYFIFLYFHLRGTFIRTGSLSSPCVGSKISDDFMSWLLSPVLSQLPHFAKGNNRFS